MRTRYDEMTMPVRADAARAGLSIAPANLGLEIRSGPERVRVSECAYNSGEGLAKPRLN
jgi:hypothetical protein